jgi:VWFA-related protein
MRANALFASAVTLFAAAAISIAAARPAASTRSPQSPETPSTRAAQPPEAAQQGSVLESRTRLVTIDVVATDAHGNLVPDLTPEDFEISDGQRQKLVRFSFVDNPSTSVSSNAANSLRAWPKGFYTNQPNASALTTPPTVILLDALNTEGANLLQVRHQMLRMLATLPAQTPVAVLLLEQSVVVVQDFTSDPALLRAVLDKALGPDARSATAQSKNVSAHSDSIGAIEVGSLEKTTRSLEDFEKKSYARAPDDRAGITLDTLAALARYLGGYPGRKNLIWVSASFPISLSAFADPDAPDKTKPGTSDATSVYATKLKEAANSLTEARVAVYPVDALGPQSEVFSSAQESGAPRRPDTVSTIVAKQIDRETSDRMAAQETMDTLARGTGGKPCMNYNDLSGCIDAAMRDSSSYYELAYSPENVKWDGSFRAVSVKTTRPGVKLAYRRGYFARDLKETATAESKEKLLQQTCTDLLPSTTISIAAQAVRPTKSENLRYRVDIAPRALSFAAAGKSHKLNAELAACFFTAAKANTFQTVSESLDQSFSAQEFQGVMANGVNTYIDVPKAATRRVRIAVLDLDTGLTGALDVPVRAEDFENLADQPATAVNVPELYVPKKGSERAAAVEWSPPRIDPPTVSVVASAPPCTLADILKKAGARAEELSDNLQNFDAREQIRFEQTDPQGMVELSMAGKFDYLVDFGEHSGHRINETRTFVPGTGDANLGSFIDAGLPVFAMIFHPALQSDYDMRCEGLSHWKNSPAWVVYFEQRKGQRPRTVSMGTAKNVYPVAVKGRAWIAADSGQIMHLETNLVNGLAALELRANAVSVDYAPVKFQSQNVEIWLPQSAVVYTEYFRRRTIIQHTFSDFQLFSVQTRQVIATKSEQKTAQKSEQH